MYYFFKLIHTQTHLKIYCTMKYKIIFFSLHEKIAEMTKVVRICLTYMAMQEEFENQGFGYVRNTCSLERSRFSPSLPFPFSPP